MGSFMNKVYRTRKIVKSADLNGSGSLFGGQALAWIDEEAAIFAMCRLNYNNLVTAAMSSINFRAPAKLGDIVEIGCDVVRIGRTSITVSCTMRNKTTQKDIVTVDEIVFVAMEDGKPKVHGVN